MASWSNRTPPHSSAPAVSSSSEPARGELFNGPIDTVQRLRPPRPGHEVGDALLQGHRRLEAQAPDLGDVGVAVADVAGPELLDDLRRLRGSQGAPQRLH